MSSSTTLTTIGVETSSLTSTTTSKSSSTSTSTTLPILPSIPFPPPPPPPSPILLANTTTTSILTLFPTLTTLLTSTNYISTSTKTISSITTSAIPDPSTTSALASQSALITENASTARRNFIITVVLGGVGVLLLIIVLILLAILMRRTRRLKRKGNREAEETDGESFGPGASFTPQRQSQALQSIPQQRSPPPVPFRPNTPFEFFPASSSPRIQGQRSSQGPRGAGEDRPPPLPQFFPENTSFAPTQGRGRGNSQDSYTLALAQTQMRTDEALKSHPPMSLLTAGMIGVGVGSGSGSKNVGGKREGEGRGERLTRSFSAPTSAPEPAPMIPLLEFIPPLRVRGADGGGAEGMGVGVGGQGRGGGGEDTPSIYSVEGGEGEGGQRGRIPVVVTGTGEGSGRPSGAILQQARLRQRERAMRAQEEGILGVSSGEGSSGQITGGSAAVPEESGRLDVVPQGHGRESRGEIRISGYSVGDDMGFVDTGNDSGGAEQGLGVSGSRRGRGEVIHDTRASSGVFPEGREETGER